MTRPPRKNRGEEAGGHWEEVRQAFTQVVDEGVRRLERSWPALLATGTVGGIDVSIGVFGLMVVQHLSGNKVLAALAFTIGFIALELGRSELFTENYLVPIARSSPAARASVRCCGCGPARRS